MKQVKSVLFGRWDRTSHMYILPENLVYFLVPFTALLSHFSRRKRGTSILGRPSCYSLFRPSVDRRVL